MGLKEARQSAARARRLIPDGLDPIEERRKERARSSAPTFGQCVESFLASNETGWRNAKHRQQWRNALAAYALPPLRDKPVDAISVDVVLRVLTPIWTVKPETASRLRDRIEQVLDWARARGYCHGGKPGSVAGASRQAAPEAFPSADPAPSCGAGVARNSPHDLTGHGFRSTFRDWCAETTNCPREVCEQALAHTFANNVEAAYRRGDLFEKRRRLMSAWAVFSEVPGAKRQ